MKVKYSVESSWVFEDKEKRACEYAVVVADYGGELGTETIAVIDTTDFKGLENLIETIGMYASKKTEIMKTKDKLKRVALSIHLNVDRRVLTRFDQDFTYKGEHYSVQSLDEVDPTPEVWENDYITLFFGEIDGDFYTNEVDTIEIDGTVHKLIERQTYFIFKTT